MESKRQQKFSRLIQKEMGDILQRQAQGWFGQGMVTVTVVRISPDLSHAKVYLSTLNIKNTVDFFREMNEEYKPEIRKQLGLRIGKQVRIVPDLTFYHDDSAEYAARMEELFKSLDIPKNDED